MPRGVAMTVSRAWAAAVPATVRPASSQVLSFSTAARGGRNGAQRREQLVQFAEATRGAVAAPPSVATPGSATATVPVAQPAADSADPAESSPSFSRWSAANCSPTTRKGRRRAVSSFLEATRADLAIAGAGDATIAPTATTYTAVSEAAPPPVTPAQENVHAHREGRQAAVKHFMDVTRGSNSGAVIPPTFDLPTDASNAWWRGRPIIPTPDTPTDASNVWWRGRRGRQHLASASA